MRSLARRFTALFAALTASLVLGLAAARADDELPSSAPLFAATLWDTDDRPAALERFRGRPLVVNFWARWCGPCRQEIPELIHLRNAYRGKIEVLGIGLEDKPEAVREFAKAYEMDYQVLLAKDKGLALMLALGNNRGGLPFTVVIDRDGRMLSKKLGVMKKPDLDAAAAALLHK